MLTGFVGCVRGMGVGGIGWLGDREIPRGGLGDVVHVERLPLFSFCRTPTSKTRQQRNTNIAASESSEENSLLAL